MSHQQLTSLIQCRLSQAQETLREAKILLEQSAYRGSINRSYYAMFYAAVGLLGTQGLGTSKHSGVISLLDREFVKKGLSQKLYPKAFTERLMKDKLAIMGSCCNQSKQQPLPSSSKQRFLSSRLNLN